jgi:pimeloyl-ACP methyl ester carboxylesterase
MTVAREFAVGGRRIEAEWQGPPPEHAPTLVLLHEGLGCVALWKDFPAALAARTGYGVLTYSRFGYGRSAPASLPRPRSYLHDEAYDVLPAILDQAGVRKTVLVGHSDGASISAIYAGGRQDARVRGVVLIAPHFFVEDVAIEGIKIAKEAYEHGDLRARLARHHGNNVDCAFRGWSDTWLDPAFRDWRIDDGLAHVRVPMLIIQGRDDHYGTPAQIEVARTRVRCPFEALLLEGCGHAPQVDQPEATLEAIAAFSRRALAPNGGRTSPV